MLVSTVGLHRRGGNGQNCNLKDEAIDIAVFFPGNCFAFSATLAVNRDANDDETASRQSD
jgi:hypothetical protein